MIFARIEKDDGVEFMKVLTPASQERLEGSAVTIGTFDGLHLGHRRLLDRAMALGENLGVPSVAVTFNPHPASVIRPEAAPKLINSFEERLSLLEEAGIDFCFLVEFDAARALEPAQDFVRGTLVAELSARAVVVGPDFRFGHGRGGDVALLERMGEELGFIVEADPFVLAEGDVASRIEELLFDGDSTEVAISSTLVRRLVARGEVSLARELLGRDFFIAGLVGSGDGRGSSELGYPTANVAYRPNRLLPADGVYAGWVRQGKQYSISAISVGTRPTFYPEGGDRLIEAFLLDFSGDLYGREVSVGFRQYLRVQEAFDTSAELVAQIERDVTQVRALLR